MSETDDSTPYVVEALRPIVDELDERLASRLSERDRTAVMTALSKAAIACFRQGAASVVFSASQQGVTVISDIQGLEDVDLWAERYGDNDPEEPER